MTSNKTQVAKDFKTRSVLVSREFTAPIEDVWRAYTEGELLDKWWGPSPWRAETKSMNFSVGGYWLYSMVGPENERHWGRMDYLAIDRHKSFQIEDSFCDENGVVNTSLPVSRGSMTFTATANGTLVEFNMVYETEEALKIIVEMGFEQGISVCLDQLQELFDNGQI